MYPGGGDPNQWQQPGYGQPQYGQPQFQAPPGFYGNPYNR